MDPPRIGFLSQVPANADDLLRQAVVDAQNNGGNFEGNLVPSALDTSAVLISSSETLIVAPTAAAAADGQITVSAGFGIQTKVQTVGLPTGTIRGSQATNLPDGGNNDVSNNAPNAAFAIAIPGLRVLCLLALPILTLMF